MLADKMRHRAVDTGAEVCAAGDSSCLMHIGGGLSRLRTGVRTVHLAEILASTECATAHERTFRRMPPRRRAGDRAPARDEPFPEAAARGRAGRHASCGATSATRPRRSGPSGPRWSARCPTGRSCAAAGAAIKDDVLAHLDELPGAARGAGHRARRDRALGPGRRRGQPDRHRAGPGRPAPTRWSRSSRWPPRRSGSTRRSKPAGIAAVRDRPGRADRPARPRQAVAHPGAGDPPQPGRDPGDLPARDGRASTRPT